MSTVNLVLMLMGFGLIYWGLSQLGIWPDRNADESADAGQ